LQGHILSISGNALRACPRAAPYFLNEDLQKNMVKLLGAWKSALVTRALREHKEQEMTLSQQ